MMNMGENRVQNGVTDGPESQNEVSVEKWKKMVFAVRDGEVEGSSRYAMLENIWDFSGFLRATRSMLFVSPRRRQHHHLRNFHHPTHPISVSKPLERLDRIQERLYESRSSFYPQNLSRLVTTFTVSKVLIRELYLVNPCAAEQEPLIVLLADNPFAGRIASPLDNGDDIVRMHFT
ncbi:hypothetical protein E3N88_13696 [Mikania micrantha]|uniref:Uncharacterized protein n=1 Tax=Mikania micrantha TaxID=192012 RepID=A0A5N6P1X4_9ASTR|nr:hypothetical protein E3N88_13696 [Mikania micrantha]